MNQKCLFVPAPSPPQYKLTLLNCSVTDSMHFCPKLYLKVPRSGSFIPLAAPTPHTPLPSKQQPECEVNFQPCRLCNCNTAAIVA